MAKVASAVLCSLAVFQGAGAFRVQHRRGTHEGDVAKVDPVASSEGCGAPYLVPLAKQVMNQALSYALQGQSPLNVSLHAGQYDINLWGCTVGLEMDASMLLSGFEDAQIESLDCSMDGEESVTLGTRLSFGQRIESAGAVHSNWSICGLDYPNETAVRMGVATADPGLRVSIRLEKTSIPLIWKIAEIKTFEIQVGEFDGFTCGLSGVPDFIGSRFEQWCVGIITWLAEKIAEWLDGDVDQIFQGMIGTQLEEQQGQIAKADAPDDAVSSSGGCGVYYLVPLAKDLMNQALRYALQGQSPLNVSLHAGQYDVDLWGCTVGLEMDASLMLSGFEDAQIESLDCSTDGEESVTLSTRLSFGQRIESAGAVHSNWSICGLDYPNETAVRMGVVTADPGLRVSVRLVKTSIPLIWKIAEIKTFEIQVGQLDRFTCGLSGVPDFVGSRFEQWCVGIIEWIAEKVAEWLEGDVAQIFHTMVGSQIEGPH